MNLAELQKKLLTVARLQRPSDAVPYAFEKRVMARIAAAPAMDILALWNRALWRAAAPCVVLMLLLGVWSLVTSQRDNSTGTLAADLESAVYAPFDTLGEYW